MLTIQVKTLINECLIHLEQHQTAGLDTLTGWCVHRSMRDFEGRVNSEAGAPVGFRIKGLEQPCPIHPHLGEVVPALFRIVQSDLKFSKTFLGSTFDGNQVSEAGSRRR